MRWLCIIVLAGCGPDEDGDGWPDACDNCVTVVNPQQANRGELDAGATADSVGDACDPRPTITGDRVLFVAVHNGDALASYETSYGVTSVPGSGALRLGALNDSGSAVFSHSGTMTRVDCTYTVVDSSNQLQWFGVWTDDTDTDALFLEAAWNTTFTTGVFRIKEDLPEPQPERYSTDIVGPTRFTTGARFHLLSDTELVTGAEQRLTITDLSTGISASTSLAIQIPRFGMGYLEANKVIVDFEYLVIYGVE